MLSVVPFVSLERPLVVGFRFAVQDADFADARLLVM